MQTNKPKLSVLAVGMLDAVHFGRWVSKAAKLDLKLQLFPSGPNRRVHPLISSAVRAYPAKVTMSKAFSTISLPVWLVDRVLGSRIRGLLLTLAILKLKPNVLHFHELQSGGYPLQFVPRKLLRKVRVFFSPYGNDLYWYQNLDSHKKQIRETLSRVDAIFPECERDGSLARKFGFTGAILDLVHASGGFDITAPKAGPLSSRKIIAIKGYGGKWGKAVQVSDLLLQTADLFKEYEIHFFSTNQDVIRALRSKTRKGRLNWVIHPKFKLKSEEMLDLFSKTKYYIAFSESDGMPAAFLEAIACGAIPIQSSTACIPKELSGSLPELFPSKSQFQNLPLVLRRLEDNPLELPGIQAQLQDWLREYMPSEEAFLTMLWNGYQSVQKVE